jgi:hypothetical protein
MSVRIHHKAPRRPFTPQEDQQLRELVATNGENWAVVATGMADRVPRQCQERWMHYLSPGITNVPWTRDEERIIEEKVKEYGQQWKLMERYLPGRRDTHIKNHYKVLVRRKVKEEKKALGLQLKTRRKPPEPSEPSEPPMDAWGATFDLFELEDQYEAFH